MAKPKTPKWGSGGDVAKDKAQDALRKWLGEMQVWCEKARLDIIRLEGACGFAATSNGDPGPPPDEPWE